MHQIHQLYVFDMLLAFLVQQMMGSFITIAT